MSKSINDRTLALGGVFQSAWLVDQVARTGMLPQAEYETMIGSLFEFSPATTEAVFGSRFEIRKGLQVLVDQLRADNDKRNIYVMRYAIGLIQLERKLSANPAMLNKIGDELNGASHQLRHFGMTHPNVIAHLADIYANTISTLTPRIMVSGEHNHLQNTENANKVRALLLAGIRAAVLWHQCGGRRWQLLFQRRKLLSYASELVK
jgi:high frequency lysogenization protein